MQERRSTQRYTDNPYSNRTRLFVVGLQDNFICSGNTGMFNQKSEKDIQSVLFFIVHNIFVMRTQRRGQCLFDT